MNLVVTSMSESDAVKPARWPRSRNGPARAVYLRMLLGLFTLAMTSQVAPALTIQFRFGDRFEEGSRQRQALEWAADRWETQLHDPIIVTIDAAFDDLTSIGADVEGWASSVSLEVPYTDVRAALIGDVTSADDQLAVDHLPLGSSLAFRTCDPQGNVITSSGSDTINRILNLSRANAKALQLPLPNDPEAFDGTILFDHRFLDSWRTDFDPSNGVRGKDFVAVVTHEIGHVLGFTSGLELVDKASLPSGPDAPRELQQQAVLTTWDLFRYSSESLPLLDLTPGGSDYFSLDGGATALASVTTGEFNGDGFDPPHWTLGHGLMDPTWPDWMAVQLQPLDLQAMDVIGWDLVAVPEPATGVLALCAAGWWMLTRRFMRASSGGGGT